MKILTGHRPLNIVHLSVTQKAANQDGMDMGISLEIGKGGICEVSGKVSLVSNIIIIRNMFIAILNTIFHPVVPDL